MDIWLEQARATKPEWTKDSETGEFVNVGETPDWAARSRAIENIADRCGLPKVAVVDAPTASAALTALVIDLSRGLPDDEAA